MTEAEEAKVDCTPIFKEIYEKEEELRKDLDNKVSMPVTIISLISTIYFALVTKYVEFKEGATPILLSEAYGQDKIHLLFLTVTALFYGTIGYVIIHLFKTFYGRKRAYLFFPSADDLDEGFNKLLEKFKLEKSTQKDYATKAKLEFQHRIYLLYIELASNNFIVNSRRITYYNRARSGLALGLLFFTAGIAIFTLKILKP